MGYIGLADVRRLAERMRSSGYGRYLLQLVEQED
jgi:hypothetical protein